ncbi:surfeit locus protein 1-like [Liolophura sinensis]|uniref:surfeit locus protein 1-like n=1 Tax=Liolophura sinensis TaxID=3198878 RepID=UPI0031593FB4
MNSLLRTLRKLGVIRLSESHQRQNQVSHMIRRWVTEEERLQKPRLRGAAVTRSSFGDSGYVLLIIPAAAFCLGTWQVKRRRWKLDLIESLERRTTAEPIEIPLDLTELESEEMQYRRIKVRGRFDHSKELYIGPRSNVQVESGHGMMSHTHKSGLNVVTPFRLSDRDLTILVNRGWIPNDRKNPETRKGGQIEDEIELVGILRHTEKRPPFFTKGKPNAVIWLLRDVEKMADLLGTAPVFIDADRNSTHPEGPIGGQTRVTLRNEHLSYIITWYSLSAITLWMWYRRYRQPPPPDTMFTYIKKMQK